MASMNTLATIEAKPEPTTIDLVRAAVVVVDMQNDFGAEGGMFHRNGVDISSIHQAIVPSTRQTGSPLIGVALAKGSPRPMAPRAIS